MTTHWQATTTITAPVSVVWDVLTDVEQWPTWTSTVTSAVWLDDGPFRVGRRARLVQPKLGTAVWEITAVEPGVSFVWTRSSPGVTTVAGHTLSGSSADATVVELAIDQVGFLAAPIGWITGNLTEAYLRTEAAGLKKRCEE